MPSEDNVPFDVVNEVVVGDLTEVKEIRQLVPPTQDVKVRINKASVQQNKLKDILALKLEVRIVDGIEVVDADTGEAHLAYVNKPMFTNLMDLCFWVDSTTRNTQWFKNKQHLVGFKQFCLALGIDVKDVKVNDEFFASIKDKEVLVDIVHEEDTAKDPATGDKRKLGTFRERMKNWKSA